jgi:hypothetical protein
MAFEFKLSTDEIREKMFGFIKPVYKKTFDFEFGFINWIYGVYDSESKFFITYVNSESDNTKYILITENGDIFYVIADRYRYTFSKIPEELKKYSDTIQDGIKLYNNVKVKERFQSSFSAEQEKRLNEITENMKDKCRPGIDINSYEDAEKLFYQNNFNYDCISHMYNKNTVANFDKYMSDEKMRAIRGEKYRKIISEISAYNDTLSKEDYTQISKDFQAIGGLFCNGVDDMYEDMTFDVIKKAYFCGVISVGYTGFIEKYIQICIQLFPDKVKNLRPILDFINENMRNENFKSLEFYRKELDKLIYNRVEGFEFVCTTDKLREKMFGFLKPEYKSRYDLDVTHIDWTTGVYDKESGIFLTQIYYVSDGIARCGMEYYSYIVITDNGDIFEVVNNYKYEIKEYDFRIPKQYESLSDKVKEGIAFYKAFDFIYRREYLNEDIRKKLKAINEIMDDRCHKNFPINSEEDAKRLCELVNFNDYDILCTYNKKTISDFVKFTKNNKPSIWRGDKYLQMLNEIVSNHITNQKRYKNFENACWLFSFGVNETYDKQFLEAVKRMYKEQLMYAQSKFDDNEERLARYINTYAEEYSDRIKNIIPLIEFVKVHTKNRRLKNTIEEVSKKAEYA